MISTWSERVDELKRMQEQGERCMEEAKRRNDHEGFLLWQKCTSQIESMLVEA